MADILNVVFRSFMSQSDQTRALTPSVPLSSSDSSGSVLILGGSSVISHSLLLLTAVTAAAQLGIRVMFFTQTHIRRLPTCVPGLSPESLKKIQFCYPRTVEELLQQIASLHESAHLSLAPPSLIIVDRLESFLCAPGSHSDFHSGEQSCAAHLSALCATPLPFSRESSGQESSVLDVLDRYFQVRCTLDQSRGCEAATATARRQAMRTLSWKPHLGSVTLDLELEDRTLTNLTVSPVHAAIILHFQDNSSWTLDELSVKLGAPKELVHRKMALWQQHGVLKEEAGGRYYVVETGSSKEKLERSVMLIDSDEERDSNTTTQSEQREEKLQLFWAYIQAMLTNLDSMTLDRIHSMLRMFVATGPVVTEMDVNELEAFLQRKVREHQLMVSAGVYRFPKSN